MLSFLRKKKYKTLNTIYIKRSALERNHKALQETHLEAKICPVLKSNAYGHGIQTVAPIFDALKPAFLIVDSLYEAYELYKTRIKTPILILGYTHPENFTVKRLPFSYAVYDLNVAKELNENQPGSAIHIFVDTGMNREGVQISELREFVKELKKLKNLKIEGLCSHFADADNPNDQNFSEFQLKNFKVALGILKSENVDVKWRHISASAGAYKVVDPVFTMIRAGLASYGIGPLENSDSAVKKMKLAPALSFHSTLIQIKTIEKGEKVGYNCTFTAEKEMRIGILPAGYYEGVDRRLSNTGVVKIGDVFCPILGRVSMNMTTIDISKVKNPKVGDDVCIYSENNTDKNSLVSVAQTAGTIPYELLIHLSESVKREII